MKLRRTKYKIFAAALCAVNLAAVSNTAIYGYTNAKGTINYASVTVRSEASSASAVAGGVKKGEEILITDEKTDDEGKKWYAVTVSPSLKGYVRADLVTKGEPAKDESSKTENSATASVKYNNTIVRVGADRTKDVRCTVSAGQEMTIKETIAGTDGKTWYGVHFAKNNFFYEGFIRSDLVNAEGVPDAKPDGKPGDSGANAGTAGSAAVVKGSGVRLRSMASTASEVAGALQMGDKVVILESTTGSDAKIWYKIKVTLHNKETQGYIRSDYLTIEAGTVSGNESAGNTQLPKVDGVKGAVKGTNVNVRKEAVNGGIVCKLSTGHSIAVTEQKTGTDGQIWCKIIFLYSNTTQAGWIRSDFLVEEKGGSDASDNTINTGNNDTYGTVKGIAVRVRETAVNGPVICQLNVGHAVQWLEDVAGSDGYTWYKISFIYQGTARQGYIRSDFVNIVKYTAATGDKEFENAIAAFPESYKAHLRDLHTKYPKWKFEAVETGLEWTEVVTQQSRIGRNLVALSSPTSWKSTDPQAYNWLVNAWYGFDGASWVAASPEIIRFYLDPRNFLDDSGIFQFETLEYQSYQNESGVGRVLASSFMANNYLDTDGSSRSYAGTFVEAGAANGINPYHLAARCLQEQGYYGNSMSVTGTVGGMENLFNFYNIGAYAANGNSAALNGLIYAAGSEDAYYRPWNSRYRSILGGSKYVAERYIKKGQNTLYFQKFNVINKENGLYTHQYMTNLQAASSEAAKMKKAYTDLQTELVFRIPYYKNMPDTPCIKPDSTANPNNYLAGLAIEGFEMTPVFNPQTDSYTLVVGNQVSAVNISAAPIAATSAVSGTGTIQLAVGTNTLTVTCKAQSGATKNYTISIIRSE